jgi:plasmid stabilization system protein ParE
MARYEIHLAEDRAGFDAPVHRQEAEGDTLEAAIHQVIDWHRMGPDTEMLHPGDVLYALVLCRGASLGAWRVAVTLEGYAYEALVDQPRRGRGRARGRR